MREIIQLFVQELPDRMQALVVLRQEGNVQAFRRLVHQIKGAGGGYGFPLLSQLAMQVERCLDASGQAWAECCEVHLQSLLQTMQRVRTAPPDLQE